MSLFGWLSYRSARGAGAGVCQVDCGKEGRWSGPQQVYQEGPVQARVQTDTQMLGVGLFGYVGRWPTATPSAGRGSRRFNMNIDVSVAVSEKSCFRQASTRTGCAYGGALTKRCRGRHCALVAQCFGNVPETWHLLGLSWLSWSSPEASACEYYFGVLINVWWVRCRARDFVNLMDLNSFSSLDVDFYILLRFFPAVLDFWHFSVTLVIYRLSS